MTTRIEQRENGTLRVSKEFNNPSLCEQTHRDRVNINSIMRRARKGIPVPLYGREATYGDFTTGEDYQQCLDKMCQAERDFMQLPAEVRDRFENDPKQLIEFMADPENAKEAVELGLAEVRLATSTLTDVVEAIKEAKVGEPEPATKGE